MPSSSKFQILDHTDARRSLALSETYYPVSRRQYPGRMESSPTSSLKPQDYQLYASYVTWSILLQMPYIRVQHASLTKLVHQRALLNFSFLVYIKHSVSTRSILY